MKYKLIRNFFIIVFILTICTNELFIHLSYAEEISDNAINFNISSNTDLNNVSVNGLKSGITSGEICKLSVLQNNELESNVKWRNSDTSSAIVNNDGTLIGIGQGKANIFVDICDESDKVLATIELSFSVNGENKNGWIKNEETWYYIDSNTRKLKTGWFKENGNWYCFDENGAMKTGWVEDHDNLYYLKPTGDMARGWFKDSGNWYYAESNGNLKHGWFQDHGNTYYFNEDGKMQTTSITIDKVDYEFNNNGELVI